MQPKPNRQAARSRHAREQIAQAAMGVFAFKGYGAASMDDICLASACSKGGLYHHYATKGAVLGGVVERLIALGALLPPFEAATAGSIAPAALGRLLIEVWAEAARNGQLRERLCAGYATMLEAGSAAGLSVDQLLRIGVLVQLLTRGAEFEGDELARRLGIERAA
ncbi:MAG: TetR/AcrR family transcriptional regulator [Dehalococcoidia bacterium]